MKHPNARRWLMAFAVAMSAASALPGRASAYLYWIKPDFSGASVKGDEPGITLPMPGATPDEVQANLVWTLRAALNVAALQCQFAPALMTVSNYNTTLGQHGAELATAVTRINGYFKRTQAKTWQRAADQHSTRIYNGLSTLHAQISFCDTAAKVGRFALAQRRGQLYQVAQQYMREIRNSLVPTGDRLFAFRPAALTLTAPYPPLENACWDRKNMLRKKCWSRI